MPTPEMRDAIGVLLAGGQGERLWPLTRDRAKPAVPFGALYRIIDITLSNCINSDLRRVFVLTQYKALSLNRHIRAGWSPLMGLGEYIEVLPPQMRVSNQWYQGTADAVYQNIYSIGSERSKYVFILSGDHIYKMNYARMLQQHVDSGADVTVGVIEIPVQEAARQFGVIEVTEAYRTGISVDAQLRRLGIRCCGEPEHHKRGRDELFRTHLAERLTDKPSCINGALQGFCVVPGNSF